MPEERHAQHAPFLLILIIGRRWRRRAIPAARAGWNERLIRRRLLTQRGLSRQRLSRYDLGRRRRRRRWFVTFGLLRRQFSVLGLIHASTNVLLSYAAAFRPAFQCEGRFPRPPA